MSFWSADDKIPVQQTKIAIPAEHGLEYSAGQKITINIPPTVKYFQPKESYLRFDVELLQNLDHPVKLQLDGETGAQVLIRDIRIYSGGAGAVLLEEIQNYNILTCLKYDYETNDAIKNKRALTEGSTIYNPQQRSTIGATKSSTNNTRNVPYTTPYVVKGALPHTRNKTNDGAKVWGELNNVSQGSQYNTSKCLLPLNTGIFQSPKVFPSLLTEGLKIEILLEDADKVYRIPDIMHPNRRRTLGLQFHGRDGIDGNVSKAAGKWGNGASLAATPVFYVSRANNQIDLQNCPLVVGQKIQLYKDPGSWAASNKAAGNVVKRAITDKEMIIEELSFVAAGGAGAGGAAGLLKITLAGGAIKNSTGVDIDNSWYIKDDSVLDTAFASAKPSSAVINLGYKVKNTELILQTLTMPGGYTQKLMSMMSSGGAMNYDFLSFTNYKYSQQVGDRVMNMRLPLNQTKAKSILCIPTDSSVYSTRTALTGETDGSTSKGEHFPASAADDGYPKADMTANYTYVDSIDNGDRGNCASRSGLVGIADEASNYQFFYNGQLNPSRPVDLTKISRRIGVQQQPLIELEKGLAMAGINPLSFMKFRENFCISRALALQQGVYNTAGRDFNVQVNYQGSRTPMKPKLWNNYVAHIRRLVVQGDSVVVQI